ncbi:MAG: amidase, partial [Anaerolineae bacterium]|nr:amidase [Anaerolineae bacterium]
LRMAGAIIVGKTNLPPLSGDGQTDNPIFGRSNNPWDVTRTPGGSGGGGGAALAAGLTPIDIGGDIGGSLRIPAHFCGICALKPSEYRVPGTGYHPSPWQGTPSATRQQMGLIGPMARSVDDLILVLRLIAGPDGQHIEIPPVPLDPLPSLALRNLRLAWADDFGGVPITQDTQNALTNLISQLERHGCRIERCMPDDIDWATVWETYGELFQAGVGSTPSPEAETEEIASILGDEADTPFLRGMMRAVNMTMQEYAWTLAKRDTFILALERFFAKWDALLCPVTATPAFPHCPTGTPLAVDDRFVPYWNGLLSYTAPFNLSGHPAVAVPLAHSRDGLPIGLQIVGRRWGEMKLLAIARQISEVIGPFQRPPGY